MLTRSEIYAYAKKATRGAGFSWGMAEEAARAVVALYDNGHEGFAELEQVLLNADGKKHPLSITGVEVCGLTLGVHLMDARQALSDQSVIGRGLALAMTDQLPQGTKSRPSEAPQLIQEFAHRTYVPESAESRARGAGE